MKNKTNVILTLLKEIRNQKNCMKMKQNDERKQKKMRQWVFANGDPNTGLR